MSDNKSNPPSTIELANEPEALFTSWISLSLITVTVAMIFYGIADSKNIMHPVLTAILAIGMMCISISYIYSGVYLFKNKMDYLIEKCQENSVCKTTGMDRMIYIKNHLLFLGISTGFFELLITLFVIWNTSKLL